MHGRGGGRALCPRRAGERRRAWPRRWKWTRTRAGARALAAMQRRIRPPCPGRGSCLLRLEDSWQLATKAAWAAPVKRALDTRRNTPLSPAAHGGAGRHRLQPAGLPRALWSRCAGWIPPPPWQTLLQKGLIEEAGRLDLPGHARQRSATTDAFLRTVRAGKPGPAAAAARRRLYAAAGDAGRPPPAERRTRNTAGRRRRQGAGGRMARPARRSLRVLVLGAGWCCWACCVLALFAPIAALSCGRTKRGFRGMAAGAVRRGYSCIPARTKRKSPGRKAPARKRDSARRLPRRRARRPTAAAAPPSAGARGRRPPKASCPRKEEPAKQKAAPLSAPPLKWAKACAGQICPCRRRTNCPMTWTVPWPSSLRRGAVRRCAGRVAHGPQRRRLPAGAQGLGGGHRPGGGRMRAACGRGPGRVAELRPIRSPGQVDHPCRISPATSTEYRRYFYCKITGNTVYNGDQQACGPFAA